MGKNDYSTNEKKVSMAILISKLISEQSISGTMGVISWWLILWEDITMKVYASKIYEAKLYNSKEKQIYIVEEFSTPFSTIDRTNRKYTNLI